MNPEVKKAASAAVRTILKHSVLALVTVFANFYIRWIAFVLFGIMCLVLIMSVGLRIHYRSELRDRSWGWPVALIQVLEAVAAVSITLITYLVLSSPSE